MFTLFPIKTERILFPRMNLSLCLNVNTCRTRRAEPSAVSVGNNEDGNTNIRDHAQIIHGTARKRERCESSSRMEHTFPESGPGAETKSLGVNRERGIVYISSFMVTRGYVPGENTFMA